MEQAELYEQGGLDALKPYRIPEAPPDADYDGVARLSAHICETPIAAVTLVTGRQCCRSAIGLSWRETDYAAAFNAQAIRLKQLFMVQDALRDPLFAGNPLVAGEAGVRFYLGVPLIAPDGFAFGTLAVMDREPRSPTDAQIEGLLTLAEQVMLQLELRRQGLWYENFARERDRVREHEQAQRAIQESEMRFREMAGTIKDVFYNLDMHSGRVLYINPAYETVWGRSCESLYADPLSYMEAIHPEDRPAVERDHKLRVSGNVIDVEYRIIAPNGTIRWIRDITYPVQTADGRVERVVGTARDITDSKQTTIALTRSNRALHMLSRANEAVTRAEVESELLEKICGLAVDTGGYRMAWVGYAQDDEYRSISVAAHAGTPSDADYLHRLRLSWSEHQSTGRGLAGRCIRTGLPAWSEDIALDATFSWLSPAQQQGYRGAVCLPLRDKDRTFGLLALYSTQARAVTDDEITLLQELADNLAFGIVAIRSAQERQRMHKAVLQVAASGAASAGAEFFEQLARNMAEAVGAQAAFVARLLPGAPLAASMVAAVVQGKIESGFDYAVGGTPCEILLQEELFIVPDRAVERFPGFPMLSSLGASAFVGARLDNAVGQPVGMLFVLFCEPLNRSDFIASTLRIFAVRAAAELGRQKADARIRGQASLLDKAQDAIIVRAMDGRIMYWNKSAERLYGWASQEVIGSLVEELLYDDPASLVEAMEKVVEQGEWSGEIVQRRKDGSSMTVEGRWTLVNDGSGNPESILCINTDITQRKAAEREIKHLAFYDPLTRLPNRLLLLDRLQHALAISARSRQTGALLFIDLDNFKTLNDTLGHDQGDLLLQQVAERLSSCVRGSDTVARLGGDEFVVMLEELSENPQEAAAQAEVVAEKILAAFQRPYHLGEYGHYSTPSIGVTLFNGQSNSTDELLKRADLAMYQAKAAGRNAIRFFDPQMQTVVAARAALEADLRQALRDNEFLLYYQPQVDRAGNLTGAEALLRWRHFLRGMVAPAEFIPLAEETALILPLGQWVLETACSQLVAWSARPETAGLSMAVNVSARQFRHPDFVAQVLGALERSGADPYKLKLELTESLLLDNVEDTIAKMSKLKARGVGFSLDDFGTGYSSLSYLKRLPLDQLKIDQSFVTDILTDPNDASIARTIVALGQSLGLTVMAEGVETEAQRDFLARHHCDAYQGYLFGRPLPAEQFAALVMGNASVAL